MPYEDKMRIVHDDLSKKVTVDFRGERVELPGKYEIKEEGMQAGERYCRKRGWQG
jgi:hypothetical protein